jgi:hypothetical protein
VVPRPLPRDEPRSASLVRRSWKADVIIISHCTPHSTTHCTIISSATTNVSGTLFGLSLFRCASNPCLIVILDPLPEPSNRQCQREPICFLNAPSRLLNTAIRCISGHPTSWVSAIRPFVVPKFSMGPFNIHEPNGSSVRATSLGRASSA